MHDTIYQVILYQVSTDVALATTRIACKERRTIVNGSDTTALWLHIEWFHLVDFLQYEEQLTIGSSRCTVQCFYFARKIRQFQLESGIVEHLLLALVHLAVYSLLICLP